MRLGDDSCSDVVKKLRTLGYNAGYEDGWMVLCDCREVRLSRGAIVEGYDFQGVAIVEEVWRKSRMIVRT